jgi:hypothetical protein
MLQDDAHIPEEGLIFVKTANILPPDPKFLRVTKYHAGEEEDEYEVWLCKSDTTKDVRERMMAFHPGIRLGEMRYKGE